LKNIKTPTIKVIAIKLDKQAKTIALENATKYAKIIPIIKPADKTTAGLKFINFFCVNIN
jgi:hypothetical protein